MEKIDQEHSSTKTEIVTSSSSVITIMTSSPESSSVPLKSDIVTGQENDIIPNTTIHLADKHENIADTENENAKVESDKQYLDKKEEFKMEEKASANESQLIKEIKVEVNSISSQLPPLEDPSVILLSPSHPRKSKESNRTDCVLPPSSDEEIETLAEEVKHIKEDKAAEFLKEELKDKIVDMLAYQKHNESNKDTKLGQGNATNHFLELKQKQVAAQREFHQKLLCELEKDSSEEARNSAVADALGTKFEVKVTKNPSQNPITYSKSSHQIRNEYVQDQGSLSVPSKSPEHSRRGSYSDTYMSKGAFWSHSLPRSKRRVTFNDEAETTDDINNDNDADDDLPPPPLPTRPPPPAPVRQQSLNAMKDMSSFSQTYNQTLQEKKSQMYNGPKTSEYNTLNSTKMPDPDEYKLDLGPQRDPWVELYGNSVLNNTLHDRLEKHRLQKSQSAVWSGNNEEWA